MIQTKLLQNKSKQTSSLSEPMLGEMATLVSPLGILGICLCSQRVTRIEFLTKPSASPVLSGMRCVHQALESYFKNPQFTFDLDLQLEGTDFQKRVWAALREIPVGQTVSYKTLALKLKTSPRAVGNACRANPIPIIIPCHRVVAEKHVGGYAGQTGGRLLDIKKWLLTHEAALPT